MYRSLMAMTMMVGCLLASKAAAQDLPFGLTPKEATQQLRVVQDSSSSVLRGRLLRAGDESITLMINGQPVDVPLARVTRIDVAGDSVLNGAVIGAVAMGGWCAAVCGQGLSRRGDRPFAILANAGLGALIGAGIDGLHGRGRPVYIRPSIRGVSLGVGLRF